MEKLSYNNIYASDNDIIQKIITGQIDLFEVLIRKYNPMLYKIARTYGLTHHDAEDVIQESHLAAYTNLKNFRQHAAYKTWLAKIHLHKCYYKLNYGHLKFERSNNDLTEFDSCHLNKSSDKQNPENIFINKELAILLQDSILKLPIKYRSVFVLRKLEGFTVIETAELLEITQETVKTRLNRAKAMLQKQLQNQYM